MAKEHEIWRIASTPHDYKCCRLCGKINWYENESCINCGEEEFDPMDEQKGNELMDSWSKHQEYRMEV